MVLIFYFCRFVREILSVVRVERPSLHASIVRTSDIFNISLKPGERVSKKAGGKKFEKICDV